ncbi:MAG: NAD(P)-dependent alcohol dehydrogenase, partial [Stygiobacter sp.]
MKAIVYRQYGSPDVLKYEEIEKPTAGDDEILIKVHAASVNPLDYHFMRGTPFAVRLFSGLRKPKITRLGRDVSGIVETVGKKVTQFKPGDAVYGTCRGAFAKYACTSETAVVIKPNNVTFEQAAAVPIAAFTALQALRDKGQIQHGQNVLINGAAGGVGTFAVQMAKSFGAHVTGVCSTRNMEMVRSIGADNVIDYTKVNFTKTGQRYDMIFDCYANQSLLAYRRALKENG